MILLEPVPDMEVFTLNKNSLLVQMQNQWHHHKNKIPFLTATVQHVLLSLWLQTMTWKCTTFSNLKTRKWQTRIPTNNKNKQLTSHSITGFKIYFWNAVIKLNVCQCIKLHSWQILNEMQREKQQMSHPNTCMHAKYTYAQCTRIHTMHTCWFNSHHRVNPD